MSDTRNARLDKLEKAVKDYTKTEKDAINAEVSALEKILRGRTGGVGVQDDGSSEVSRLAEADLATFLKGP